MHQTFYIDAEDEISSVIDKLNKAVSSENYFVVPKRAIFLQSIVNLKLLKREADKLGKHVVIVTQDEIGASMAQRSGLEVKHTIEGMEQNEIETVFHVDEPEKEFDFYDADVVIDQSQDKKSRLKMVGSNDFYDVTENMKNKNHSLASNAELPSRRVPVNGVVASKKKKEGLNENVVHRPSIRQGHESAQGQGPKKSSLGSPYRNGIDPSKEKIVEKMFSTIKPPKKNDDESTLNVGGSTKRIFLGFAILCFFVFAGTAIYLFLPSAKIIITPKILTDKVDMLINGNIETSKAEKATIPIRVIDKEDSISLKYDVVGGSATSGKKAHGSVVIYNEYNSSPQTLVATTRLESTDGKIFRLVKSVSVPGTTTLGNETKPGAIEAEVVADQTGSDFNIAPSSFTVPGFKGSPKYEKFYAKSIENFAGGSSEGGSSQSMVTQKDIDDAKRKTEKAMTEQIAKKVAEELGEGEILLAQAEKITITKTGATAKSGDMVNTFEYNATASIRSLVFSEKDVKTIVKQSIGDRQSLKDSEWDISKLEYGTVVADFEKNTLELKIYGEITIIPFVDTEKIKNELLGKKDDQLDLILKNYSSLKNVSVEFQPTIVSRIPQYSSRVSVEMDNNVE